jgi:hypothetical protein
LLRAALIVALSPGVFSGCGDSPKGPETVDVRGTLTYNGTPIEGANVIFHPTRSDQALASQAVTDRIGRFQLSTHLGAGKFKPGIVPGHYAVTITKLDTAGISSSFAPPKSLLPKKYANPKTSGLTAEVAAGRENEFQFALKD